MPEPPHAAPFPVRTPPAPRSGGLLWRTSVRLAVLAILAFGVWRLSPALLQAAGNYLILVDSPARADLVVVHAGESERLEYAAQLMAKGVAPTILVFLDPAYEGRYFGFTGAEMEQRLLDELRRRGIAAEAVVFRPGVRSSWEEVSKLDEWLSRHPEKRSILVVSNPFHLRRLSLAYRKVFLDRGLSIRYCGVPWEMLRVRRELWWTREEDMIWVQTEWIKILHYWIRYL